MYAERLLKVDVEELHIFPSIYSEELFEIKVKFIMNYYSDAGKLLSALRWKSNCSSAENALKKYFESMMKICWHQWIMSGYSMERFIYTIYLCSATAHNIKRHAHAVLPGLTQASQ